MCTYHQANMQGIPVSAIVSCKYFQLYLKRYATPAIAAYAIGQDGKPIIHARWDDRVNSLSKLYFVVMNALAPKPTKNRVAANNIQ